MIKRLHSKSKIIFSNPYVVRLEYTNDLPDADILADLRKTIRNAYKLISGTWGYSDLGYEHREMTATEQLTKQTQNAQGYFFFTDLTIRRAYFCFKDELDAMQFRLGINTSSRQVYIWPSKITFTIHEYINEEYQQ